MTHNDTTTTTTTNLLVQMFSLTKVYSQRTAYPSLMDALNGGMETLAVISFDRIRPRESVEWERNGGTVNLWVHSCLQWT